LISRIDVFFWHCRFTPPGAWSLGWVFAADHFCRWAQPWRRHQIVCEGRVSIRQPRSRSQGAAAVSPTQLQLLSVGLEETGKTRAADRLNASAAGPWRSASLAMMAAAQ